MPKIKAFDGFVVKDEFAARVVAPEYDSVPGAVRRAFGDANPQNFINTIRLKEDFDPAEIPDQSGLLEFNKNNLNRLLAEGYFEKLDEPAMFIYELTHDGHSQTGVVCEISANEYDKGHVKKHESTRRDREDLLAEYQKAIGVTSCPICLAYPHDATIDTLITHISKSKPILNFTTGDGVHQRVWTVDKSQQKALADHFENIENTYLTDGHHRAASGWRYAEMMRENRGNHGDEPFNQLLVALFSDQSLSLLAFHRCVQDLGGHSESSLLAELASSFTVTPIGDPDQYLPSHHGEFGMLMGDRWYQLIVKPELVKSTDPVASLDVSLLQDLILDPLLGISDYRNDKRLDYVPGNEGKAGLLQKASEGWAIGFLCHATSMDQLMDVADANKLMPPKSTYFDPKTRSGLFVRFK